MATRRDSSVLSQIRSLMNVGSVVDLTDGQLLERFATGRGEASELAFATLVERHGPMVLRVCRGVLNNQHDTQDAFQATFLVLVKKARGLWVKDSLGAWLHQVAFRTASSALKDELRRRRHERRAAELAAAPPADKSKERGWTWNNVFTPRSTGSPSVIACRSCSAISRADRSSRRPGISAGRSGPSRAGCRGDASGCVTGSAAAAFSRAWRRSPSP